MHKYKKYLTFNLYKKEEVYAESIDFLCLYYLLCMKCKGIECAMTKGK